jgi:DNA (cytosine-5)-methyltransferase 1
MKSRANSRHKAKQLALPVLDCSGKPCLPLDEHPGASKSAPTLVSLFAGCGGFDLGFGCAGFRTVWANDIDPSACQTFEKNLSGTITCGDINNIEVPELRPDVLTAGFPCQTFSNAGSRKGTDDTRGTLYQAAVRCIRLMRPKAIVLENVRGLLSFKHGNKLLIEEICSELWECGYRAAFRLVDASSYRVPQRRLRLIIVGLRRDLFHGCFSFPHESSKDGLSLGETLQGLSKTTPNQLELLPLNPQAIHIGAMVPEGGSWKDIPYNKLPARLRRIRQNMVRYRWPNFYRKFHRDEIAGTVTAAFKPENAGVWHPVKHRVLSVREAARIQSFPDWFEFVGKSVKSKYQQIGNAVPPRLAYEIALQLRSLLSSPSAAASGNGYMSMQSFLSLKRPLRPTDHGVLYECS